jgi:tetratricopeptide (TPR) repeat protein/predicted aspartyl protease
MRTLPVPWRLGWIAALLATTLSMSAAGAADRCRLEMFPPLSVKMEDLRPVISASVDDVDAQFMVDTGSFFDFLSPAAAAELKLPLGYAPPWLYVNGVGGTIQPRMVTAKTLMVAGATLHDPDFLVGGNDFHGGIDGILGQNLFFRIADVEYDFANGTLRFVKPQHCRGEVLAYWASTLPVATVDLRWTTPQRPYLAGEATVNGHRIEVLFDTGAARSILSLGAARRAGITPESPGVMPAGDMEGIGKDTVRVWSAPIDKFEIGGEAIEHTRVLVGDIDLPNLDVDMLLGADFFLAHHVYVAYSQDKLYFTYNGGPVFGLNARRPVPSASPGAPVGSGPAPAANPGAPAGSGPAPSAIPASQVPADEADLMRRGMAETSRGEFSAAIADLSRACEIAPGDADCRYRRGIAYWRDREPQLALADLDGALKLAPGDYDAHLARAQLLLPKIHAGIEDDLDAVDRTAPPEADLRFGLAALYHVIGQYAAAVHQYDLWIDYHGQDIRLKGALADRCGVQAAANIDLDRALDDCDRALSLLPRSEHAVVLSNRSLVYLRLGQFDRSIADATDSIQTRPGSPFPLYVRGLAELRRGLTAQGRADLAAAQKLQPDIARHYAAMGLTP